MSVYSSCLNDERAKVQMGNGIAQNKLRFSLTAVRAASAWDRYPSVVKQPNYNRVRIRLSVDWYHQPCVMILPCQSVTLLRHILIIKYYSSGGSVVSTKGSSANIPSQCIILCCCCTKQGSRTVVVLIVASAIIQQIVVPGIVGT